MKIYTGTGDAGETGLYGGARVGKDDARVDAYGTLDEANALLGVARLRLQDPEIREIVTRLQSELFVVGADLAAPMDPAGADGRKQVVPRVEAHHSVGLERIIDAFEAELPPLRNFILPGGSEGAALLHHARAVLRRAERRTVALWNAAPAGAINDEILRYLNRLADLLFVLARAENHRAGEPDVPWIRPSHDPHAAAVATDAAVATAPNTET
jgi:cob(I)alamin adenosyltransferase